MIATQVAERPSHLKPKRIERGERKEGRVLVILRSCSIHTDQSGDGAVA